MTYDKHEHELRWLQLERRTIYELQRAGSWSRTGPDYDFIIRFLVEYYFEHEKDFK